MDEEDETDDVGKGEKDDADEGIGTDEEDDKPTDEVGKDDRDDNEFDHEDSAGK
jgi:hypothetical protein